MNIYITHVHNHKVHTTDGEFEISKSKAVKGDDIVKIAETFCVDDINFREKPCNIQCNCVDCWINELQEYNKIIDSHRQTITFEKVERE